MKPGPLCMQRTAEPWLCSFFLCITHNWFCMKELYSLERTDTSFLFLFLYLSHKVTNGLHLCAGNSVRRRIFTSRSCSRRMRHRQRWHWYIKKATTGLARGRRSSSRCEVSKNGKRGWNAPPLQLRHCRASIIFSAIGFCGERAENSPRGSLASLVTGCVWWIDSNFTLRGTWNMNWKSSWEEKDTRRRINRRGIWPWILILTCS